eukprot:6477058-Amphidinium_carterae.1
MVFARRSLGGVQSQGFHTKWLAHPSETATLLPIYQLLGEKDLNKKAAALTEANNEISLVRKMMTVLTVMEIENNASDITIKTR